MLDQITGLFTTLGIGVLGVAAIYQLSKPGGQAIAKTGAGVITSTTQSVFK